MTQLSPAASSTTPSRSEAVDLGLTGAAQLAGFIAGERVAIVVPRTTDPTGAPGGRLICQGPQSRAWEIRVPAQPEVAVLRDQIWIASRRDRAILRVGLDGAPMPAIDPGQPLGTGRWFASRLSNQAVWAGPERLAFGPGGAVVAVTGDVAAPLGPGRWLAWQGGHAALIHAGDRAASLASSVAAWRVRLDEPAAALVDATALIDGRFLALLLRVTGTSDLRLAVLAARDGQVLLSMRLSAPDRVCLAPARGALAACFGDVVELFDLRFGRSLGRFQLPEIPRDMIVDGALVHCAWFDAAARGDLHVAAIADLPAAGAGRVRELVAPVVQPNACAATAPISPAAADGGAGPGVPADASAGGAVEGSAGDRAPDPAATAELLALPGAPLASLHPRPRWPRTSPTEARQDLEARLHLLAARVSLAIAHGWDAGRIAHVDRSRPPYVAEVTGILDATASADPTAGLAPDLVAIARERCRAAEQRVDVLAAARGDRLTPLEILGREQRLSGLAGAILLAAAAPLLRGDYARLYGILAHDPHRAMCDEHLLVQILGHAHRDAIARELDGDQGLRRSGVIGVAADAPRPFAAVTVEPLVLRMISGLPLDGEAEPYLRPRLADRDLPALRIPVARVNALLGELRRERAEPVRVVVRGRLGSGRRSLCAALAQLAQRTLGVIDVASAPRDLRLVDAILAGLRRATVRGWVPCIEGLEHAIEQDRDLHAQVSQILRDHPGPLFLRLGPDAAPPLAPGFVAIDVPALDERGRAELWLEATARCRLPTPAVAALAARHRIGPGIIERVCGEIAGGAAPRDGEATTHAAEAAVRQHLDGRVSALARRVDHLATWSDVVLPDDVLDSLVELTGRVRHRRTVLDAWGYSRTLTTSRGLTALFTGTPGTGKTMVAGVLARDLGVDLYRIDVSRIASKWIGETEKNLGELFDAAEDGQVMLLFDEAESLFAKRTEVKTSVDRYANMEINYLLQRLDSFEGIAILTSNFSTSIDPAFRRRLSFRVTFPFPDEDMREQLWRAHIPPEVPRAGEIDFFQLARRFTLSGGYIRNASLRAAFLAAEEGSALSQAHIERAVRAEFREIGKLAETGRLD